MEHTYYKKGEVLRLAEYLSAYVINSSPATTLIVPHRNTQV